MTLLNFSIFFAKMTFSDQNQLQNSVKAVFLVLLLVIIDLLKTIEIV